MPVLVGKFRRVPGQAVSSNSREGQGSTGASPVESSPVGTEGELRLPASSALQTADLGIPDSLEYAAMLQFNVAKVSLPGGHCTAYLHSGQELISQALCTPAPLIAP